MKVSHNRTTNSVTLSLLLRKCANVEHFATYRVKSSDSRLECALKSFPIPEQLFLVFEWLLVVATVPYSTILAPAGCQVIIRPNLDVSLTVKDCRKDVSGHLSSLKLSADEDEETEMNLLLARVGK